MLGTIVNCATIIVGSLVGILLHKGLPEKLSNTVMMGVALCVLYIGISGSLEGENTIITIISVVVGGVIGYLLDLDGKLNRLGQWIEGKFKKTGNSRHSIAEAFVSSSILYCVGAMAIVGSLQSGLTGNHEMLFTKSILDGISSVIFASSLGIGTIFSVFAVLIYQGSITLLAQWISPYLNDAVIADMTCAGSILIIGLALNLLKLTDIKVANYLPAIFLPILFYLFI
ncbi:MAG: DUF554 domain-containing protein [Bacillota bacterium]|jgi:uncharacterized membrane protein YqgA involved in biofilm formation